MATNLDDVGGGFVDETDSHSSHQDASSTTTMTDAEKRKIQQKRQEALLRKRRKLDAAASSAQSPSIASLRGNPSALDAAARKAPRSSYFKDTEAGFLLDPEEESGGFGSLNGEDDGGASNEPQHYEEPAPTEAAVLSGGSKCLDCKSSFYESFLSRHFSLKVCDACRKEHSEGKYGLVSKTTAKNEYLLRDSELAPEMGGLRFVERKNPHKDTYAKMKLYLRSQVEELSFKNFGGLEGLEEEHGKREDRQTKLRNERHQKKMTKLRKETLTNTWLKKQEIHTHDFGEEAYNEDTDEYSKTCTSCGFTRTYEKL